MTVKLQVFLYIYYVVLQILVISTNPSTFHLIFKQMDITMLFPISSTIYNNLFSPFIDYLTR